MAGKIHKVRLFERWAWLRHLPDWQGVHDLLSALRHARERLQDDTLLGAIVDEFAARASDAAGHRLCPGAAREAGQPDRRGADRRRAERHRVRLAAGQGDGPARHRPERGREGPPPLAVEAVEGTDECIRRAGALCAAGGFTVVKVAKPQQDMRFDVPTIGLGTLETMAAAGGRVLAVEAGRTIIVDQPEVVDFANRHKLVVVALDADGRPALAQPGVGLLVSTVPAPGHENVDPGPQGNQGHVQQEDEERQLVVGHAVEGQFSRDDRQAALLTRTTRRASCP